MGWSIWDSQCCQWKGPHIAGQYGDLMPYNCWCHHDIPAYTCIYYPDIPAYTTQIYYPDILPTNGWRSAISCGGHVENLWLDGRWDQSCHRPSLVTCASTFIHPEIHGVCICWRLVSTWFQIHYFFGWDMMNGTLEHMFNIVGNVFWKQLKSILWGLGWAMWLLAWIPGIGWLKVVVKTDDCLSLWIGSSWGSLI